MDSFGLLVTQTPDRVDAERSRTATAEPPATQEISSSPRPNSLFALDYLSCDRRNGTSLEHRASAARCHSHGQSIVVLRAATRRDDTRNHEHGDSRSLSEARRTAADDT